MRDKRISEQQGNFETWRNDFITLINWCFDLNWLGSAFKAVARKVKSEIEHLQECPFGFI